MNGQALMFESQEQLAGSLTRYGVEHTLWDQNKGLRKLWDEYIAGECDFFSRATSRQ